MSGDETKKAKMEQLSDRTKAELESLQDQGITPTWEEVIQINSLVMQILSPTNQLLSARGNPLRVGGAILWPLTVQASDWWQTHDDWFDNLEEKTKALAYLLAHGRRSCLRARLASRAVARRAVFYWCKKLPCTYDELLIAVNDVLRSCKPVEDEIPEEEKADSLKSDGDTLTTAQAVAFLSANTGIDPDYWERKVCVPFFSEQIRTVVAQGMSDDTPARDDPRIIAERNLGYYIMQIENREKDDGR